MKRLVLFLLALAVAAGTAHAGTPVWVTSDVPTDETVSGSTLLPWEIYKYDGAGYTLELSVPGSPDLNAIHRLDDFGDWLFSVEAPSTLGGVLFPLGAIAEPRDLVHYDSAAGTYTLCFSGAAAGLAPSTNVNAVTIEGGDPTVPDGSGGILLLSFDAPTDVGPFVGAAAFEPSDLARFIPLAIGICPGWTISAANPAFDGSAAGSGIPLSSITEGADRARDYASGIVETYLSLDIPSDLFPPAATYSPGELIETDTATFALFEPLGGWPIASIVDGLSCGGNPGRIPADIKLDKAGGGSVKINWSPSCSQGAADYGIYEGRIGSWYSHAAVDCLDGGTPFEETITPGGSAQYYLVVPFNRCRGEGSYGSCDSGVCLAGDERPKGAATCSAPHVVTSCP
jgi:hypothetical protein